GGRVYSDSINLRAGTRLPLPTTDGSVPASRHTLLPQQLCPYTGITPAWSPHQPMLKEIPVVAGAERSPEFVQTVGQAFRGIGFVFPGEPEITAKLPRIYAEFRKAFDLPYWIKAQYARPEIFYQRGWTPPFTEEAIACRAPGNGKKKADAKENWFM